MTWRNHNTDRKEKNFEMIIREYQSADCKELTELFYNTVHTVNAKDYTKEQLDVWATGQVNLKKWNQSLQEVNTPTLRTDRLILRKFIKDDLEALFEIFSDEEVNVFLPWYPLKTMEDASIFSEMAAIMVSVLRMPVEKHQVLMTGW